MTKRIQAKYKSDRRFGLNLWGRPKSPVNKRQYGPGQHGQRRKGKTSDFGLQLVAKQKLRMYYGNITEKQFRKTYEEAARRKGNTAENLIGLLESRLDAVVYRSKFTPTVFSARQFVNHGHVKVNGKRLDIPSYVARLGDKIDLTDNAKKFKFVLAAIAGADKRPPASWLEIDRANFTGTVKTGPVREDLNEPEIREQLIVEYYSR